MGCLKDFCYNVQKGLFITTKSKKKKITELNLNQTVFFYFYIKSI